LAREAESTVASAPGRLSKSNPNAGSAPTFTGHHDGDRWTRIATALALSFACDQLEAQEQRLAAEAQLA
jgi:hypothetical protein